MRYLAYLILILTIGFNLWLNYPETKILADPNDNIFQFSLVGRTNWVWENYGCPLSLSCLPNLLDHNVPNWAEGYPLPFYYSHVPQIVTVASYNLAVKPVSSLFISDFTLYEYYNWTKYLLLAVFPLTVFLALRFVGFSPLSSALGAFFSSQFSTDGLYGIDPPSYLWRGYGLTSQLYAIVFLPLAIAFVYRRLKEVGDRKLDNEMGSGKKNLTSHFNNPASHFSLLTSNSFLATLFLALTTAGHLGVGIIGFLSAAPFLFLDFKVTNIIARFKKLTVIYLLSLIALSYWIIPILLNNNYHIISFWDPIWKFNSYGWYEVVRQFWSGEIFDWQRFPIITALVVIGFFVLSLKKKYFPFSLLFALWFLLYFGRTTWGGLLDLIPGMKDFHQSRFVVGIHVAALFLIPAGLECLFYFISNIKNQISNIHIKYQKIFNTLILKAGDATGGPPAKTQLLSRVFDGGEERQDPQIKINIIFYILIFIFISALAYFTTKQTITYASLNNKWIYEANDAYRYDEQNFKNLLTKLDSLPAGRIYAGRPGNWGKAFRLGSTQLYLLLGGIGYDISQFLPETWSPLSENEQNFDEREAVDYDLLNIRYTVSSNLPAQAGNEGFAPSVRLADKFGPFALYEASSSGWFDVVTSSMFVKSDKTNYLNLVHMWWKSYARRWKMHPLISVEKNPVIPPQMEKIIEMKDEVTYLEIFAGGTSEGIPNGASLALSTTKWSDFEAKFGKHEGQDPQKNIFSDYPFVFPQATVSGKIKSENVDKQTYSAEIEVPDNCKQCFAMFKMSYHPDWQVKVDGASAEKFAVFPFYLATPISPGTHTVEFTYQPNRLKVILLAGEILVGIIFLLFRKKIKL